MLASGQVLDGKTVDASTTGLGLLIPMPIGGDTAVQVAVQVPLFNSPGKFQVVAGKARVAFQVLRGNEYHIGVEWTQLEPSMRQLITQYLEKLSQPQRG